MTKILVNFVKKIAKVMKKIRVSICKDSNAYAAYSDNCPELYASGTSIEDVKKNIVEVKEILKEEMDVSKLPVPIREDWPIEWNL